MPDPDNWSWVNEMPPAWEPPAELMLPTNYPGDNLVVIMVGSGILGNDVLELVGEFLAEQSRLTMWIFGQEPRMTLRDQTLIGRQIDSVIDSVYQRWLAFQSVFKVSGGRVGTYERERDALRLTLREGNNVMREARAG